MRIRSVTAFIDPRKNAITRLHSAAKSADAFRKTLQNNGYEVSTMRLATRPFWEWVDAADRELAVRQVIQFETEAASAGFDYIALGPADAAHVGSIEIIPDLLKETSRIFCTANLLADKTVIHPQTIRACAKVIMQNGTISPDGFANLRFSALAGVKGGTPFFPAAYYTGSVNAIGVAVEAADLVVEMIGKAGSARQAADYLVKTIEDHAHQIEKLAITQLQAGRFIGIDFTLAPYPSEARSIGTALQMLGLHACGESGSLAASAFLMSVLDSAKFKRTGFNGLMLPVLEDSILALQAANGHLSIQQLLLYSTVCGTGLDCIPLPGDTSVDQLSAILMDVAALSARLAKPLTARLMPIPGKAVGDETDFNFEYFANSRVMSATSTGLCGYLGGNEPITIQRRVVRG